MHGSYGSPRTLLRWYYDDKLSTNYHSLSHIMVHTSVKYTSKEHVKDLNRHSIFYVTDGSSSSVKGFLRSDVLSGSKTINLTKATQFLANASQQIMGKVEAQFV